ncbi:ERF family protein [Pseudovibrio sp. SPO723]|uniref:ERF family protein n=1 Tax=Nesiotobacter zosterae TaxID=392721 RepID=UPI0029C4A116|nr:ERF family protein [Pseudovibrio sp. SPO723]MDX5592538.1 ERF family protein [Pseudovibrio sp. SPO723]
MFTTSDKQSSIISALMDVHKSVTSVGKDGRNPHFKNNYATLENVIMTLRDACNEHGIIIQQFSGKCVDNSLTIITRITHTSGEWQQSETEIPMTKRDPQQYGSALTYGRRYALLAAFNLPTVDDDAEKAMGRDDKKVKTVSEPEIERLRNGLRQADWAEQEFLSKGGYQSIDSIPSDHMQGCLRAIAARIKQKAEARTGMNNNDNPFNQAA